MKKIYTLFCQIPEWKKFGYPEEDYKFHGDIATVYPSSFKMARRNKKKLASYHPIYINYNNDHEVIDMTINIKKDNKNGGYK
jgi:hypothetical protein